MDEADPGDGLAPVFDPVGKAPKGCSGEQIEAQPGLGSLAKVRGLVAANLPL